jgi:hypothetical protein
MEEMGALRALHGTWGQRVPFLGISWELFSSQGGPEVARSTVERVSIENGMGWRHLVYDGAPDDLFTGLELPSKLIPQTFLLDGNGSVRFHHVGALGSAEIRALEAALTALFP